MGPRLREDDGYVYRHGALTSFLPPSVIPAPFRYSCPPSFLRRQESIPAPAPRFTADGSPPSRGRRICLPSWRFTVTPAPLRHSCPLSLFLPSVIPAEAGIHPRACAPIHRRWVPAVARTTGMFPVMALYRRSCTLPLFLHPPSFLRRQESIPAPASITTSGFKARLPKPDHGVYADFLYGLAVYTFAHKPVCGSLFRCLQ